MVGLDFVHLHVHSSYSLLEGALTIARLAELAKADRQPALALTDTDNMFGALEFSEKMSGYGIQPIIGCSLAIDFGDRFVDRPGRFIGTLLRQRIEHIGNGNDSPGERDIGSGSAVVAVSVPTLVMVVRDLFCEAKNGEPAAGQDARPD